MTCSTATNSCFVKTQTAMVRVPLEATAEHPRLCSSRWRTCSHQPRPLPPPPPVLTTLPRSHRARHSPLFAAPVRLADSQNQSVWPCFFSSAFPPCVLLLLLPGVNLRRREKKTYPSFPSVRGPLLICFYFPPRWYRRLPRRASQLASFPSPS